MPYQFWWEIALPIAIIGLLIIWVMLIRHNRKVDSYNEKINVVANHITDATTPSFRSFE